MQAITTTVMCACMALAAGSVTAADDMTKSPAGMGKGDMMKKGEMMKKDTMTMQQCKDHMRGPRRTE